MQAGATPPACSFSLLTVKDVTRLFSNQPMTEQQWSYIDPRDPRPTREHYREIHIPKIKLINGVETRTGTRIIHEPCPQLKALQQEHLRELSAMRDVRTSSVSHAFTRQRDIRSMAEVHVGKKNLVRIDIKDFFPSINKQMLQNAMMMAGYPLSVISRTLKLCFLNNALPQGAPTSPFLSNIVGRLIDARMLGLSAKWRNGPDVLRRITTNSYRSRTRSAMTQRLELRLEPIAYSRYADDLVFSSDYPKLHQIRHPAMHILTDLGFVVNKKKILVNSSPKRLVVCGITVNDKISKPRDYRRRLRAHLHNCIMQRAAECPIDAGMYRKPDGTLEPINFDSLAGQVSHITYVCPEQGVKLKHMLDIAKDIHHSETFLPETLNYIHGHRQHETSTAG